MLLIFRYTFPLLRSEVGCLPLASKGCIGFSLIFPYSIVPALLQLIHEELVVETEVKLPPCGESGNFRDAPQVDQDLQFVCLHWANRRRNVPHVPQPYLERANLPTPTPTRLRGSSVPLNGAFGGLFRVSSVSLHTSRPMGFESSPFAAGSLYVAHSAALGCDTASISYVRPIISRG